MGEEGYYSASDRDTAFSRCYNAHTYHVHYRFSSRNFEDQQLLAV